jgi:MFS transporter, DHA1 family, inner membrane transport protein
MPDDLTISPNAGHRAVGAVLFLCLFAAQAGAIALSPVLAEVARDLEVSPAWAGQLRTVAGLVAGVTALVLGRVGGRFGLGRQLLGGATLLALGSLTSAVAPSLAVLALAQVPVGAGIALLTTAATLAAAVWVPTERRAAALSWALIGQPAAWIVGMPLIALVARDNWRYAWLVFPLSAALLAGIAVGRRRGEPPTMTPPSSAREVLRSPGLGRWLAAELLANTAWAGLLVYSGALFVESYREPTELVGAVLAVVAGAYVAGNLALRRVVHRDGKQLLVRLALLLGAITTLFGALRPSLVVSAVLFSAAAFAAGGRTFISSAFGLAASAELRPGAMAMRAASMQFGYFTGSLAAGAALALGGYPALGSAVGALFLASAASLAAGRARAAVDRADARHLRGVRMFAVLSRLVTSPHAPSRMRARACVRRSRSSAAVSSSRLAAVSSLRAASRSAAAASRSAPASPATAIERNACQARQARRPRNAVPATPAARKKPSAAQKKALIR